MAESAMGGLFQTPEMYQQARLQQQQEEAARYAQMDPMQRATYGTYMAGQQLGSGIAQLFGVEDPQLRMISQQQRILGQIDPKRPETFYQAAQMARDAGIPQLAFGLLQEADKYEQQALVRTDQARVRTEQERVSRALAEARLQQLEAQKIAEGAYLPAMPEQEQFVQIGEDGQPIKIAAQPASFDISRVAPELMRTAEGRAQLEALTKSQKLLRPETVTVKEGDVIFSVPNTPGGPYKEILSGGEKPTPFTGEMANAALVLYQTTNPAKIFKEFGQSGINAVNDKAMKDALARRPSTTINMPNEGERKAATLSNRLNFSVDQINQAIGIDPTAAMPNTGIEIARFLSRSDMIPNKLTPAQRQIVESAQLDILDAALTLGTGAAYTREQLEGYRKSYFPQISDKPETVVAKRARLQNILVSAEIASGRAKVPTRLPSPGANLNTIITAPPSK